MQFLYKTYENGVHSEWKVCDPANDIVHDFLTIWFTKHPNMHIMLDDPNERYTIEYRLGCESSKIIDGVTVYCVERGRHERHWGLSGDEMNSECKLAIRASWIDETERV